MSCPKRNIRNMDTTIYRQTGNCCGCDDFAADVQSEEMLACCHSQNYSRPVYQVTRPNPHPCCPMCSAMQSFVPPLYPFPPAMPPINVSVPTADYAQFYSALTSDETYAAGTTVPAVTTIYNTAVATIVNAPTGAITLIGGPTGKAYVIDYQISGTNAGTTFGLNVNGTVPVASQVVAPEGDATVSGRYIVEVPANSASTVALQVVSGSLTAKANTASVNLSVLRIR